MLDLISYYIYGFFRKGYYSFLLRKYKKTNNIHESVILGQVLIHKGSNVTIMNNTYFNSGMIQSGRNSKVVIGRWCAIGYNVSLIAISHDINIPTGPENERPRPEGDIIIGDNVWIGSNVFINKGVNIGDNSIIGANSVITKDIPSNTIYGGVPAKLIRNKGI